jgi:signal transduction histidine kinase
MAGYCGHGRGGREGARRRLGHSLFLKLLLVLLAAGVLVNVCVGGFFRKVFFWETHAAMQRNLVHYAGFLAEAVGSPPDTARARALSREYSLDLRYEGPGGTWETSPGLADLPGEGIRWRRKEGDIGWRRGRYYVKVQRAGASYLFATDFHGGLTGRWPLVAVLLGLVSLILAGTYLAIRRLLRPLRDLSDGVERLGRGELGSRVPDRGRKDELGDLARAFNGMSARLEETARAREQLLLDVSHELRSPLTRIKVALEMSPEGGAKESIRDDLGEMEGMIGELLESARLDSEAGRLDPEPVDLPALVQEVARGFEGRPPGLDLRLPARGPGFVVDADRERVRKVISNVIDNALKYSRDALAPAEIRFLREADAVVLSVRDHGVGIPAAEIPRIFQPFYRVDPSRSRDTGGYGLGLSLCKRIMEAHGGGVTLESESGKGALVRLRFPARAAPEPG